MPNAPDWLPGRREHKLAMAKNWLTALAAQAGAWQVPAAEVAELQRLAVEAEAALRAAESSERTPVIIAHCKAAFATLAVKMRFVKSRYFLDPPLSDADFIALGLKPKNRTPAPIPPPVTQAEADILLPGIHMLELRLRPLAGSPPDPHQSAYGCRIHYGIMPPGGATVEAATRAKRELMQPPITGEELPHSRFTRRKKERFDFSAEERGKTIYFCLRYENAKGEPGPWGPIFSAIIP
jgi:hypothetical protein